MDRYPTHQGSARQPGSRRDAAAGGRRQTREAGAGQEPRSFLSNARARGTR